jgi:apolipoprotein N-acyltransferase
MTAAFPPLDFGFIAWFGLAPLLFAVSSAARPRTAFALGYIFGCIHWGLTVTWIGTTVVAWSGTPLGWIAWILLVAIKSLWFGLFGFSARWVAERSAGAARILGFAAAWAIIEWLRGQSAVAMPWSLTGYTQYRYPVLVQAADLGGVYLISFAVVLFNAGIAEAVWNRPQVSTPAFRPLVMPALLLIAMLAYGGFRLNDDYPGQKIRVALMQPNERSVRTATQPESAALAKYRRMASKAKDVDFVIWPESSAEHVIEDVDSRQTFEEIAQSTGAFQVVGTGFVDESNESHNSAALFGPSGKILERYDKHQLVPFGEWVPLRAYLPFGQVFGFPPKDVVPGTSESLLTAGSARMSVLICYESVFPVLSRVRTARGANLLVSITNDSWAGESAELQQHHAMTVMRAVETRRFVGASSTTGITALIDPTGNWSHVPPYRERILTGDARLCEGLSPYVRWGDWFIALCGILVFGALARPACKNTSHCP